MKLSDERRPYRQTVRAQRAAATRRSILDAVRHLAGEIPLSAITLAAVAERADVSVQTVLRHFGSREKLLDATLEYFLAEVGDDRRVIPGDVDDAVRTVVEHYERFGDTVMMVLTQESIDATAAQIGAVGREFHDRWVRESFRPSEERAHRLLVVATDLYTWKLLRRDRALSAADTEDHMRLLCRAVIETIEDHHG